MGTHNASLCGLVKLRAARIGLITIVVCPDTGRGILNQPFFANCQSRDPRMK